MKITKATYSKYLKNLADKIDIPPSKYHEAVNRYKAVGEWLEAGKFIGSTAIPKVYPQGSFRLGTVVRPIREGIEQDYDIDLVFELLIPKWNTKPRYVKTSVGSRLRENEMYRRMLDEEGKRCWTLIYAEKDGVGFHLDVLPSVLDCSKISQTAIAITNKQYDSYIWSTSDPNGYALWFDRKNSQAFRIFSTAQKREIQSRAPHVFASVDDVPNYLVRTPLQKAIQLMKRHRDMYFSTSANRKFAPISVIITTLAAELYECERDVFTALKNIVTKLYIYTNLISSSSPHGSFGTPNLIERSPDGRWLIVNPVNSEENFADRWHEDGHQRAKVFFAWVEVLKRDLVDVLQVDSPEVMSSQIKTALGLSAISLSLESGTPSHNTVHNPPSVSIPSGPKPWGFDFKGRIIT